VEEEAVYNVVGIQKGRFLVISHSIHVTRGGQTRVKTDPTKRILPPGIRPSLHAPRMMGEEMPFDVGTESRIEGTDTIGTTIDREMRRGSGVWPAMGIVRLRSCWLVYAS
jgi:hypothetical protein